MEEGKSGWTDEQLFTLSQRTNHKVVKVSKDEWMWMHQLKEGKWENHCVRTFEDKEQAYSYLLYSLAVWSKELRDRSEKAARTLNAALRRLEKIKKQLKSTTTEKIREIKGLNLNFSHEDIANELGVTSRTVRRALEGNVVIEEFNPTKPPKVTDSKKFFNINDPQAVRTVSEEYLAYVALHTARLGRTNRSDRYED